MSGLTGRPTVEDAITKVQRVYDVIEESSYLTGKEESSDENTSDEKSDDDDHSSKRRKRQGKKRRANRLEYKKSGRRYERKIEKSKHESEASKICQELEELKLLLTKRQNGNGVGTIPSSGLLGSNAGGLPALEAYAVGNRLAPPAVYQPIPASLNRENYASSYSMNPSINRMRIGS